VKNFGRIALATALLATLSACGSNPAQSDNSSSASSTDTSVASEETTTEEASGEFTLYTSQPEEDVAKLIAAFNEETPDIKVNVFRSNLLYTLLNLKKM